MASPSPTPCPDGFVVKNGSKIRSRSSARMPWPVSLIAISMRLCAGSKRVLRINVPVPAIASAALTIMFMKTCCICEGSTTAAGRSGWRFRMIWMLWNVAWFSTRAMHSWRMTVTLAGRTCGGHAGGQLPGDPQPLGLPNPALGKFPQLLVPLLQRGGHGVEGVCEVLQFIVSFCRDPPIQPAVRHLPRGGSQPGEGGRDPAEDVVGERHGEQPAGQGDGQEGADGPPADVHVLLLQHPPVPDAARLAVNVADGLVGRDVPVVHHEGAGGPALSLADHAAVDIRGDARADRPTAVGVRDVGGDPEVVQKDGGGPHIPAAVPQPLKDRLLDLIHDLEVPVLQHPAVEKADQAATEIQDGGNRLEDHPGRLLRLSPGPRLGRGGKSEVRPIRGEGP